MLIAAGGHLASAQSSCVGLFDRICPLLSTYLFLLISTDSKLSCGQKDLGLCGSARVGRTQGSASLRILPSPQRAGRAGRAAPTAGRSLAKGVSGGAARRRRGPRTRGGGALRLLPIWGHCLSLPRGHPPPASHCPLPGSCCPARPASELFISLLVAAPGRTQRAAKGPGWLAAHPAWTLPAWCSLSGRTDSRRARPAGPVTLRVLGSQGQRRRGTRSCFCRTAPHSGCWARGKEAHLSGGRCRGGGQFQSQCSDPQGEAHRQG